MKKFYFSVVIFIFTAISVVNASEIVYVNVDKVYNRTEIKKLANSYATSKLNSVAKKLKIKAIVSKYQKGGKLTQAEYLNLMTFQRERQFIMEKMTENLKKVFSVLFNKFGKKYGYTAVVAHFSVVYGKPKYNKTEQFINFVNQEIKKNRAKYKSMLKLK